MVKPMPLDDFRAIRHVLESDDFAQTDGKPEPAPSDLISEETWHQLVRLPDDVSIRTSNRHGTLIRILCNLASAWIQTCGADNDLVDSAMVEVMEDFEASIYNLLVGYYPLAIGCLRGIVDGVGAGAGCQVGNKAIEFTEWQAGRIAFLFNTVCHRLDSTPGAAALNLHLRKKHNIGIFDQKQAANPAGWARDLYERLSRYAHARPRSNNVGMWLSNGPIYVPKAVAVTTGVYVETLVLCYIMVKVARPQFDIGAEARAVLEADVLSLPKSAQVPTVAREAYKYLFGAALRLTR